MNIIDIRRSIRKYDHRPVENDKIEKILRAGMQSPSACNQQGWEFLIVKDKVLLQKISEMSPYSSMVATCAFAIVLLGNMERCTAPDYWQQDLGACAQTMLLEIVNQGLGAVWLGVAPMQDRMEYLAELFKLQANLKPFCVIPVGYPDSSQENKFVDRYDAKRVKYL